MTLAFALGEVPRLRGMNHLMRAGGGLSESAFVIEAELTRYEVINGEYRQTGLVSVDLAAIRAGDESADVPLQSYDFLNVKEVTDWGEQQAVTVQGEVRFPGDYPIRKGETLQSVVERAGGLMVEAFPAGAVFTRESLKAREREQIERLTRQMGQDLASPGLSGAQAGQGAPSPAETLAAERTVLEELRTAERVGRLALDLPRALHNGRSAVNRLMLQDGDVLMVPGTMQSVTVIGQVQSPTSHLHYRGLGRDDYITLSGGFTQRAHRTAVYVIRANGQVSAAGTARWFRAENLYIIPGDTIVVPMDVEQMQPLPVWAPVTTNIYNVDVSVAAVNSF